MLSLAWLTAMSSVNAQQPEEARNIKVRLICNNYAQGAQTISLPTQDGGFENHQLGTRYLGVAMKTSATSNLLNIYHPNSLPTPEKPAKPIATVKIPAEGQNFAVLLLAAKKNNPQGLSYHGVVLDMNKFSFGSSCMLNLTNKPIIMKIDGKAKALLQPGRTNVINHKLQREERKAFVELLLPKAKRPFFSSYWNLRKDTREINLLFVDPATKRTKMKTIVDIKPPEVEAQQPE